jgi:hypothetical protein
VVTASVQWTGGIDVLAGTTTLPQADPSAGRLKRVA